MKYKLPSGICWTGLEKILISGVGFVQGVFLARLLSPGDFGLTAMLSIFLGLGTILAESGLNNALVALGTGAADIAGLERRSLRWNVCAATVVYAALLVASPAVAAFYHESVLVPLIAVLGLSMVLHACCVVGTARLNREQRFGALTRVNAGAMVGSSCVGIALAYLGWGVWAIAVQNVAWAASRLIALTCLTRRRREAVGTREVSFRDFLAYGLRLVASGVLNALYANSFQLLIGRLYGAPSVGLYTRGQRWSQLPGEVVNGSVGRVAFVSLSSAPDGRRAGRYLALNVALLWPGLVVLGVWAPFWVGLVLGTSWLDCVPYLRVLLVGAACASVSNLAQTFVKARGDAGLLLKSDAVKLPADFAFLAAGAAWGIEGLCWAKVAGDAFNALVDAWCAWGKSKVEG